MEELKSIKRQFNFIYLLISFLYLLTIFNFSLYIHFYNQINHNYIEQNKLSNQQIISSRLVDENSVIYKNLLNQLSLDQNSIDLKQLKNKNELNDKNKKERFKRDVHQFNLPTNLDLSKVWSNEDENLKQKLINSNYELMFNDDHNVLSIENKKIRSVNDDQETEKPTLYPPIVHQSQTRSTRHRSHHQKRRLSSTTTEQSTVEEDQKNVEFYSQPQQTTGQTNGKVWLNSYSRIPVSTIVDFFFENNF